MEEIRNEEIELMEAEEMENYDVDCETSGRRGLTLGKVALGLLGAGIAGVTAYVATHKEELKEKRNERRAAKLEAEGYIVARPDQVVDGDEFLDEMEAEIDTVDVEE